MVLYNATLASCCLAIGCRRTHNGNYFKDFRDKQVW